MHLLPPAFQCPDRSTMEDCVDSSSNSCPALLQPGYSETGCSEGCQCHYGNVFDGGECVSYGQCGCVLHGRYIKVNIHLKNKLQMHIFYRDYLICHGGDIKSLAEKMIPPGKDTVTSKSPTLGGKNKKIKLFKIKENLKEKRQILTLSNARILNSLKANHLYFCTKMFSCCVT